MEGGKGGEEGLPKGNGMSAKGEIITMTEDGKPVTPDFPIILFIEGDGTGPDIWRATQPVLDEAVFCAYGASRRITWHEVLAGEKAFRQTKEWLPQETLDNIRTFRVAIKGPITTPVGGGFRSVNVSMRQELDLYCCVRPVKYIPGVPSPVKAPEKVDMVVFRENTEDVYAGIEWPSGSEEALKVIHFLNKEMAKSIRRESGIGIKPMSPFGSKRLIRRAIQWALENGRKSVTLVHKGNIMKYTEGAFREWGYQLAQAEFGDRIIMEKDLEADGRVPSDRVLIKDRIADAMFQQILLRPDEYDVLALPNLNGDFVSDALAAQVGGLGMAPGANMGDHAAVFEATHGTAPKYAGLDKVNPGSLILSGTMMLDYLGWPEAAQKVREGLINAIAKKTVTYDLARQMAGAKEVPCSGFAEAIIKEMACQKG